MEFSMELFWAVVVIATIVAEMLTVGLVAIWMTGGALLAMAAAWFGGSLELQLVCFFGATLALLYWTRPFAVKFLNKKRSRTNVEETIGSEVRVIERVSNSDQTGKVNYKGMEWTARAVDDADIFEVGDFGIVDAVEGVTMRIQKKQK